MSASLLNTATLPGAAPAGVGIVAQAGQAAQAKGPLAGFEALLAAFFGDQGLTVPAIAGQAAGQTAATQPGVTSSLAGAAAPKTVAKDAVAGEDPAKDAADTDPSAATASVQAALALAVPLLPTAQAAPAPTAPDGGQQDAAPDAGLAGRPAAAIAPQVQLAVAADATPVKAVGLAAQDTTPETTKTAVQTAVAAPPPARTDVPAAPQAPAAATPQTPALYDAAPAVAAEAQAAPAAQTAQAKPAETPAAAKDKVQTAKTARIDGARIDAPAVAVAGKTLVTAAAFAGAAGKDAAAEEHDPNAPAAPGAKPAAADSAQAQSDFGLAANAPQAQNPAALAHAAALVRGSPQTVANLAAQIAKKLDGRTSRFDVQLDPAGLGKVDVRVEIDAAGKMTAAMNFDSQQAANELRSRAGELQRALEQAGFDMSGGLSFDVSGQGGQGGRAPGQNADDAPHFRGRAFQAALDGSPDTAAIQSSYSRTSRSGVDIRI